MTSEGGKIKIEASEPALGGKITMAADRLVLSTAIRPREAQGLADLLGVELNPDGFFKEAEIKFRPVEFVKDGLFLCGLAQSPRNVGETLAQARAAAQRVCTLLGRETLRSGARVSEVSERRCVGCEICIGVCPYGARFKDEELGIVVVREALCQNCGACAVACPSGAASMRGFSGQQIFSMIDLAT